MQSAEESDEFWCPDCERRSVCNNIASASRAGFHFCVIYELARVGLELLFLEGYYLLHGINHSTQSNHAPQCPNGNINDFFDHGYPTSISEPAHIPDSMVSGFRLAIG